MKNLKNAFRFLPLVAIAGIIATMIISNGLPKEEEPAQAAAPSISMTINGGLNLEVTPEVDGAYGEAEIGVLVKTNSELGYSLTMGASDVDLILESEKSKKGFVPGDGIIHSVDGKYAKNELPLDSWGFSVDGGLFAPIPSQSSPSMIKNTSTASPQSGDTTTVTFGVNISPAVRSGDYESVITLLAVANVAPCVGQGFYCIDTMQAMTPEICDETTTPYYDADEVTFEYSTDRNKIPRTILTDVRDGKTYLVSKFADGKCWMSQNLDLELDNTVALTSATTDLNSKSSWTPDYSTTSELAEFARDSRVNYHFTFKAKSARPQVKYLRNGITPSNTPSRNDGTSDWEKVGIYYNIQAATAGSIEDLYHAYEGYESISAPAEDSICPRGWKLPLKDDKYDYTYYRYFDDVNAFGEIYNSGSYFSERLAFIASGGISVDRDDNNNYDLIYLGEYGKYWTIKGFNLYYEDSRAVIEVSDSDMGSWWSGFIDGNQIRCINRDDRH